MEVLPPIIGLYRLTSHDVDIINARPADRPEDRDTRARAFELIAGWFAHGDADEAIVAARKVEIYLRGDDSHNGRTRGCWPGMPAPMIVTLTEPDRATVDGQVLIGDTTLYVAGAVQWSGTVADLPEGAVLRVV